MHMHDCMTAVLYMDKQSATRRKLLLASVHISA